MNVLIDVAMLVNRMINQKIICWQQTFLVFCCVLLVLLLATLTTI